MKNILNILSGDFDTIYSSLSRPLKIFATQACIHDLMLDLKVENLKQLYAELETKPNEYNHYRLEVEKQSGFYAKKMKGEPLKNKYKIKMIKSISSKANESLNHKLWALLSFEDLAQLDLSSLREELGISAYTPRLFWNRCCHLIKNPERCGLMDLSDILLGYTQARSKSMIHPPLLDLSKVVHVIAAFLAHQYPNFDRFAFFKTIEKALKAENVSRENYPKDYHYSPEIRDWLEDPQTIYFADIHEPEELELLINQHRL
ncbi:hypothetical protein [Aliiglaciecola sp. LCG003]|uniref:hypothetical protein n=1 Tax=Aliiglaciecola sp. LCG003 TaxID=3053655 RepID=UPI00257220BC|nr:hypothetical protein [Aliiglaciecola sp. LCG003]WJG07957.1 hypothetical protein QR722_11345 [Aliiglaciecola sp. LCG003]